MSLKTCPECGLKKDMLTPEGVCQLCHWRHQEEEDRREIINTSMHDGIITRWNATPSFLSKKLNSMYFRIPPEQLPYFDPNTQYEIIIKEAST